MKNNPRLYRLQQALIGALLVFTAAVSMAKDQVKEYDLTIAKEPVNITGKSVQAMTLNGGIPGPVLRFTEGDLARIRVHNTMDEDASIHWHGMLLPNPMDGVPNLTFPPIAPHATFTYEFPIRQSGTYWYHSHTRMQEQRGVYGAIVIESLAAQPRAENEHVIVLSDWTDTDPHTILRSLRRGSEWESIQKGTAQSLLGSVRAGKLGDYLKRELTRMPPMDLSDVAYDRFLANGKPSYAIDAQPGTRLRLRFVDGSAATYFHLQFAGGALTIISADGQPVEPVQKDRFLISVAETYDVFIDVPKDGAYELRATAHDGSGHASIWIGHGSPHPAPQVPSPNLYHFMGGLSLKKVFALTPAASMGMPQSAVDAGQFDPPGPAMKMDQMSMKPMDMQKMDMGTMDMSHGPMESMPEMNPSAKQGVSTTTPIRFGTNFAPLAADVSERKPLVMDGMAPERPWPPYKDLKSTHKTSFTGEKSVREVRLTLDGDMERFVWFINNKPLSASDVIRIRQGEVVRFIMINRTMMHHPMHLHGHFFRVLNGQGDYSPLKHTVNVEPMSTTVIEYAAAEQGDWFFHCHILYHMEGGMSRIVHYENFTPAPEVAALRPAFLQERWLALNRVDAMSNMAQGHLSVANTLNTVMADYDVGWQSVKGTDYETTVTWERYRNRFFTAFAGANIEGTTEEFDAARGVFGIRYELPFRVHWTGWVDTSGGGRFIAMKEFQLTPRLSLNSEAEYDSHHQWEGRSGLAYQLTRNVALISQWHSDYRWGGGLRILF